MPKTGAHPRASSHAYPLAHPRAHPFAFSAAPFIALGLALCGAPRALAKVPVAIWHVEVAGQDSLFNEGLARDMSQALAEDTALKVFDARKRGAGLLDSLHARTPHPAAITLRDALPNKVELALRVECRQLETGFECRTEGRFIVGSEREILDTARYAAEASVQRRLFGACIMRRWREKWHGMPPAWSQGAMLVFRRPALPARLLRDLEILQEGAIVGLPPGTVLETGDMANPAVSEQGQVGHVFYGQGRYAYPMPHVLQVLEGKLGLWPLQDTTALALKLLQGGRRADIDSVVLLTPSCILRGRPRLMRLTHEGSETRFELVQGELTAQPLLGSQDTVRIPELHQGKTRGFSLDVEKMEDGKSERISSELASIVAPRSGKSLAEMLPGKLFGRRRTLPVLNLDVQDFLADQLAEIDASPHRLGPPEGDAATLLNPLPTGKHEAGCYLCRPDRLGP